MIYFTTYSHSHAHSSSVGTYPIEIAVCADRSRDSHLRTVCTAKERRRLLQRARISSNAPSAACGVVQLHRPRSQNTSTQRRRQLHYVRILSLASFAATPVLSRADFAPSSPQSHFRVTSRCDIVKLPSTGQGQPERYIRSTSGRSKLVLQLTLTPHSQRTGRPGIP